MKIRMALMAAGVAALSLSGCRLSGNVTAQNELLADTPAAKIRVTTSPLILRPDSPPVFAVNGSFTGTMTDMLTGGSPYPENFTFSYIAARLQRGGEREAVQSLSAKPEIAAALLEPEARCAVFGGNILNKGQAEGVVIGFVVDAQDEEASDMIALAKVSDAGVRVFAGPVTRSDFRISDAGSVAPIPGWIACTQVMLGIKSLLEGPPPPP